MFTNTPQLFGAEIQSVASVTFDEGRIVRWVDYWDGRHFGREQAAGMRVPDDQFPGGLGAETTTDSPDVRIRTAATDLMGALTTADLKRAAELLTPDAVWEDLPLHLSLHGRTAVGRFLTARGRSLPYGRARRRCGWSAVVPVAASSGCRPVRCRAASWPSSCRRTGTWCSARSSSE